MQVTVDEAGTLRKKVTLAYDAKEVRQREDELLDKYAGQVRVKGFRRGKMPRSVVRARFGKAVTHEAADALVQEGMRKALDEHGLSPIGPFETEDQKLDNGITHVVSFDIRPTVTLPDPTSLELPKEDTAPSAEEIDEEIDDMRQRMGSYDDLTADDELAEGDVLTLIGRITAGEEEVRQIDDLHHIVGAYPLFGTEPSAVVELITGKKPGEILEFDTTLPDNFKPEEWAGKDAHVSVTIQRGQRQQPAPLDDELAQRLGTESVDDLRQRISDGLEARKQNEVSDRQTTILLDQLIEQCDFELPPKLRESLIEQRLKALAREDAHKDKDPEQLQAEQGDEVAGEVDRDLRRHIILDAIADQYNVKATERDVSQQVAMAARQSKQKPEDIFKHLKESGRIYEVLSDIREHKALELMRVKALGEHEGDDAKEA